MKLSSLLMLGYEVNAVIDAAPDIDLSFTEVHAAAQGDSLIPLLEQRFGSLIDLSLLGPDNEDLPQLNAVLRDASEVLKGVERKKVGVENKALCLVIAIILQAIAIHSKK
jgi:hypothetical protein